MRKGSIMSVSSPRLVSMAIGEKVDLEELGGWRIHAEYTGLIDRFTNTDEEAMGEIRTFLSYMPNHNMELPPEGVPEVPAVPAESVAATLVPPLPERARAAAGVRRFVGCDD